MAFNKGREGMEPLKELIESIVKECKTLKGNTSCDFVGLALQNKVNSDIKWPYAIGNRNEKHQYITVRYGKGIAGKVIATGSPMEIGEFPNDILGKSTEYPIMLAEQLVSALAVPLAWNGSPKGALLIGYRKLHSFSDFEQHEVEQFAQSIEEFLPVHFEEK